jgi:CheY-like chemotaxis protein
MNSLNVLLAEDETADKDFFIDGLKKLDLPHRVSWVKNHTALFELLEKENGFDLIIIDLDMPGKNGKECLKEIKANEKYKSIPVVVMTVSKNTSDINDVFDAGAHYYAVKPYSERNYIETLRQVFNIDWKTPQPVPDKKQFIINFAFA